jgi:hypothetical protein
MDQPEDNTAGTSPAPARQPWVEPEVAELELSRTANNPSVGSDGGTADCSHV